MPQLCLFLYEVELDQKQSSYNIAAKKFNVLLGFLVCVILWHHSGNQHKMQFNTSTSFHPGFV